MTHAHQHNHAKRAGNILTYTPHRKSTSYVRKSAVFILISALGGLALYALRLEGQAHWFAERALDGLALAGLELID